MKDQTTKVCFEINKEGKLTKSQLQGNVNQVFKAFAAAIAYIIEANELDKDSVIEYFQFAIDKAFEDD